MKNLKRLLSSALALLLVFCSMSAGMVVLAAEETAAATAATPFASFTVGGQQVDFNKSEAYSVLNFNQSFAKLEWVLNDGWDAEVSYYPTGSLDIVKLNSGDSVQVTKDESVYVNVWATKQDGSDFKNYTVYIFSGKPRLLDGTIWMGVKETWLDWSGFAGASEVVSIKSSNKAVLGVKKKATVGNCILVPKKPGSSKITLVAKINGEEKTFTAKYTVKAYPNALKELKVGGKAVNLKKNKFYTQVKTGKKKVKVTFKVAKGWKAKCGYYNGKKYVYIKSGGTIPAPKWVFFRLTKGKDVFFYEMDLLK